MRATVKPLVAAFGLVLAGCTVGPDYERPPIELPEKLAAAPSPVPAAPKWWTLFGDPVLDALIEEALAANRDLAAAAARVEQARAKAAIARGEQLPAVGLEAQRSRDRSSERGSFPPPPESIESTRNYAALRFSWELDFWGKYRRASEAARAELLAAEAGRDAVRASLVAETARAYFAMRALDESRAIALRTLEGRRTAYELLRQRHEAGVISALDLNRYEAEVRAAEALVPALERERTQVEGSLAVLLGRSPAAVYRADIARGTVAMPEIVDVPADLPSDLLRRRPDLREAEARLIAANARIGVARAAYYPSISLTGFLGSESQALSDLFSGPARTWSLAAGLLQPVYLGWQIQGGVDFADARTREAAALYERAVAQAFKEVRDAIVAQSTARAQVAAQRSREAALARAEVLARARYEGGVSGLLELLDAGQELLATRVEAINAERIRRNAVVDLYLALGA
jgi:multidrug efflux system outer membrane protein